MDKNAEQLLKTVVKSIEDKKGVDIVSLDLAGISLVADYFVITHGNSERQVQAIATSIKESAVKSGVDVKGIEGLDSGRWVLIDLGDVVVHVFHREDREYYRIERLWSDAKVVENT
ncbi:ribosome silencing factor [Longirhabdus pacifica]|uniref:ribosome silencing factor n=1 Tax=Longirhabdus pacifica TaxID=2305227 RepID=UPI00100883FA|nr:ribosome silencing factor [Longirhabdus pacifica]